MITKPISCTFIHDLNSDSEPQNTQPVIVAPRPLHPMGVWRQPSGPVFCTQEETTSLLPVQNTAATEQQNPGILSKLLKEHGYGPEDAHVSSLNIPSMGSCSFQWKIEFAEGGDKSKIDEFANRFEDDSFCTCCSCFFSPNNIPVFMDRQSKPGFSILYLTDEAVNKVIAERTMIYQSQPALANILQPERAVVSEGSPLVPFAPPAVETFNPQLVLPSIN